MSMGARSGRRAHQLATRVIASDPPRLPGDRSAGAAGSLAALAPCTRAILMPTLIDDRPPSPDIESFQFDHADRWNARVQ
jgi:hypothetical protein